MLFEIKTKIDIDDYSIDDGCKGLVRGADEDSIEEAIDYIIDMNDIYADVYEVLKPLIKAEIDKRVEERISFEEFITKYCKGKATKSNLIKGIKKVYPELYNEFDLDECSFAEICQLLENECGVTFN